MCIRDRLGGIQRIVFMITDAPPHGTEFYDQSLESLDEFKNGCPCKIDFKAICKKIKELEISFNIVEILDFKGINRLAKFNELFEERVQDFQFTEILPSQAYNAPEMTQEIINMIKRYNWWKVAGEQQHMKNYDFSKIIQN
eukprot:TRINITY_DN6129_c0_g1_i2.p3 TRINITY_DN6129_c0_g1~~TRINITY_DN6129_c0_g1_i2.p3  ORF type:complete len:141 (-),score=28.01 TRINITY_DN6129_c0_g1_i2:371-793(-)